MSSPEKAPRLVRACRGEALDRPPVWLMRQAGRYMPEYQAIRGNIKFMDLCKNVDLAVEVSLQPYKAFGMDGVIMFSDILTIPNAMGMDLHFSEGKGPIFSEPIRHVDQVAKLPIPDPHKDISYVPEILGRLKKELASDPATALIGFSGSPWTLAAYMIEGGSSKNFTHLKTWMLTQPDALHTLLDKLAKSVIIYLNAQIEAGAQVVQLFDTWAGILSREEYTEFVLPYHRQILQTLKRDQAPAILYVNNSRGLLDLMQQAGPDVISVDTTTSLTEARKILGSNIPLQGNLDSNALFADAQTLTRLVTELCDEGGNQNYIFNLGHGILPTTPVENVRLLVDTIKQRALTRV